ncbi:MAG TPA: transglycosylase domain-containing protein, partial [Geminicoccaceae bacterium]|nr:transglycosylase domain-containing protein [Geminicoccaceae bacterium]
LAIEFKTSWVQADLLSGMARGLTFSVEPGPSDAIRFPSAGPYDERLGYVDLPGFVDRLGARGFTVGSQARLSARHRAAIDRGAFPIYHEKTAAGIRVLDRGGAPVFEARFPERTYTDFESVPPLVVASLLFIENRELLEPDASRRNPAVEWSRAAAALWGLAVDRLTDSGLKPAGGSTLATQIEKYRHAPAGRTEDVAAKLRQMVSASLRAYREGPDTSAARRQIVVDYLNSTPLSARAGFGEVHGLGDGLWVWFGTDFERANQVLRRPAPNATALRGQARIYKQALSLLLAQRRPSYYLLAGRDALADLTDAYLRLLGARGVIDPELQQAALEVSLEFLPSAPQRAQPPFVERKAANAIRTTLLRLLGLDQLYRLDRLDLEVATSLDLATQQRVIDLLRQLSDPRAAGEMGLYGHRLLDAAHSGDPLIYSLTLYERGEGANYLRVQADNLEQPFDINEGAKLDLGSTAKLRTLITYLEIIADLHARLTGTEVAELKVLAAKGPDPLSRWAAGHLASAPDRSLAAILEAAMRRGYSASPWEGFFTGGGVHRFANFNPEHNGRTLSVAEAFRHSVNLVFVRLMRDIVRYYAAVALPDADEILADRRHPAREAYLIRFADREGTTFLNQFYEKLAPLGPDGALERLASEVRPRAERLAVIHRSVRPEADPATFAAFLQSRLPGVSADEADRLYERYAIDRFSLADRAYIARVHPLKLWLAGYLQEHADATRAAMVEAGAAARQESYVWLFRTRHKRAQDRAIRILLEEDAFARIAQAWRRLGYPFESLVPSYATSIGSSADRPEALAELIGIILNDGVWQPSVRVERLHFAAATPYETVLERDSPAPARVLAPEIAAVVRDGLIDIVEAGTAQRLRGAFTGPDQAALVTGAKTGTGDNRKKYFARGGRLVREEVVSRTATVVFFIGERFFGNLTVYVPGAVAADFGFTSSLPAQLLKAMAPALQPLLDQNRMRTASTEATGGA